jgi:hypothetical protein
MRFGLLCLMAIALMATSSSGTPPVEQSIVALTMPNLKGVHATFCSGVVAQTVPVAYIMTEAHCLDGADIDDIRVEGKALAEVARKDDVVLLKVQGMLAKSVAARVAAKDPVVGTHVVAAGWAFGKVVLRTFGQIAGEYDHELYSDMQCVKGMSGGPVTDDHGHVVSLVRAFQTDSSDYAPSPNGFLVGAPTRSLRDLVAIARSGNVN